ncbi:uncharacterized protein [Neodiprion pinetum]|uniref:uncharacterized protein LOC124177968 n=1 Tax=Neodiprion fabricii TaxID=2872261 RepID=UPI00076FA660|nr:uncharacterized protein LOC124177968 [Neodiprion fabricii]XP_046416931.1 uncharacterized protein LOC124177968 [Neodiprion fabricii]XP_046416932.1 uncharacterized protein LOC124177968 [Neodiprion fabricii]XP_046416933.1 uncharacterized protein LOC124177968 [Neodiprion fabricii]XP_046416934.1 uncharacterized protein LOC124177968 [Neodiprion fabricii]XP_046472048.1 uncharacterized protein LOC124214095 [Neodiprion pinetum]XP_046472049.1 uncharacterized protein LOC124214095 [Neodiprion pinetum]
MPHPCVVCGRSRMNPNNRQEEYMFFGFPVNDETRCKKWLEFCCREDLYKLTKKQLLQRMVCSKHFEQRDFLNSYFDRLNCTAIPSIYDPKQSLYNITCVLCGRSRRDPPSSTYDGVTFHHFPGEEFRCLKWLDFVGVDSYYRLTRKEILFCYICSKHFDRSQFLKGYRNRLVDHAVPNIRYPDEAEDSEPFLIDLAPESKLFHHPDRTRKLEALPQAVLESQACAACGRSRSDPRNKIDRYKFHPFPAYEIGRCLRWCQFLGREDLLKMSPNQIRKLVLCSKHFQSGQSFHRVGPCDAVPTIRDIHEPNTAVNVEDDFEEAEEEECAGSAKGTKKQSKIRPMVSSKKPKIDNKPAPLAKKRGKSKRPTQINIPRPDPNNIENRMIRKLPLPPNNNWKLIQAGTMQPITIANNIATSVNECKKMILPFTGDITNLGTPIPVHSLSSMPPGLLIKINLPDQNKKPSPSGRRKGVRKGNSKKQKSSTITTLNNIQLVQCTPLSVKNDQNQSGKEADESVEHTLADLLTFSPEREETVDYEELGVQEEIVLSPGAETTEEQTFKFEQTDLKDDYYYEVEETTDTGCVQKPRVRQRRKLSSLARKTILPIKSEIGFFLRKFAPKMQRLPKKARAQLKLSIVNMVIDNL